MGNTGHVRIIKIGAVKHAIVTCNSNYKLKGLPVISCTNGVWKGAIPSCEPR